MKRLIIFLFCFVFSINTYTQQSVEINTGGNITKGIPYSNEYEYNWCTVIYQQDQIGLIGSIDSIGLKLINSSFTPGSDDAFNQKIYMAHTTDQYFSTGVSYTDPSSMTLVYDGMIRYTDTRLFGQEITKIILDTPFEYNNSDNLIIHLENRSADVAVLPEYYFNTYSGSSVDYPTLHNEADGSFPASGGTRSRQLPRLYLYFGEGVDAGVSEINDDMLATGVQDVKVKFSNYYTDEINSVAIDWEVDGTPQTTYNWSGSLPSEEETNEFTIGSFNFSAGEHTIKAWTVTPNAGIDEDANNDTLEAAIIVVDPVFVDKDAVGTGDGSSWANAYDSLHTALESVGSNTILWVAEGTYYPTNTTDRTKSFAIPDSVWVYGGFAGTETSLSERQLAVNRTILSGNIGDVWEYSDNSYHVVTTGSYIRLDGCSITWGMADLASGNNNLGGGLLADGVEDVFLSYCTFENNYAEVGGGVNYYFGTGLLLVENCNFFNNLAGTGGAIDCHDAPSEIHRSVFAGNYASTYGGAIFNWGAGADHTILHCSFYDNKCPDGSAIHNRALGISGDIKNSIFYGNEAPQVSLSSGAEGDTDISYSLIDQAEFSGNNNITGNPLFADTVNYDLQIMGGSPCIDAGDPDSEKDPDGTVADMGVYHFDLDHDAGVTSIFTPPDEFQAGIADIKAGIKNFGKTTLTEVAITCEIDGVHHSTTNWTGSLAYPNTSPQINLGSHNFGYGMHTIKVWTSNPNAETDEQPLNDTMTYLVKSCEYLSGIYNIGSGGHFETVKEAVDSMSNMCGISGPVTFNILPGTYDDQIIISDIHGLSEANTITFQSFSGDSTDAILTTDSTDYLVFLDGADYITFKNISFSSSKAAKLVIVDSGACNNVFTGNVFTTPAMHIYSGPANDSNNVYQNNLFEGGETGLHLLGSVSDKEKNTRVLDNTFTRLGSVGVFLQWSDSATVSGNEMLTDYRGIHFIAGHSATISKNKIRFFGDFPYEGIYMASCGGDTTQANLIANNFISGKAGWQGAISISYSSYQKLYYNSVNVTRGLALKLYHDSHTTMKNNILISDAEVLEWYADYTTDLNSDYNSFYSGQDKFVLYGAAGNLEEWQDTSKQDANSIYFYPLFEGEEDLHTTSFLLDSAGTPVAEITEDIDGEERHTGKPDIGADEFDSPCTGLLSGNYSIGTSGDYAGFNEAWYAVKNCGVEGTVTFTVENGTYTEQVHLEGFLPEYTVQDSIIFESSGDPESVVLTWEADTLENYTVWLDGVERVAFRNISIEATDTSYGTAVLIGGGAHQNLVENCIITGSPTEIKDEALSLILMEGNGTDPDTNNTFRGNTVLYGSYGIYLKSSNPVDKGKNNVVKGNEISGQYAAGIRTKHQTNVLIEGNLVETSEQVDPIIFYSGIYLEYDTDPAQITGNRVNVSGYNALYGLRIEGRRVTTSNNAISLWSESYQSAGISGLGFEESKCYHNSVNIYGKSQSAAVDISYNFTPAEGEIRNNIFSNHAEGYAIRFTYGTAVNSDYNSLFTNGEFIGECNNQKDYTDLDAWRTITGAESNSVSPAAGHFFSDTDLHTSFILFDGTATPIAAVTTDIEGNDRDPATPDMGAYEFSLVEFSLGPDQLACLDADHVLTAGEGFDSYLWSNGSDSSTAVVDSSGTGRGEKEVSVIVDLGGTLYYDTIQVNFTAPIPNPVTEYCFDYINNGVEITAGEGESYYWSSTGASTQTITATWTGDHTVTVWDENGCEATGTITVHQNSCYARMGISTEQSLEPGDSLLLNGTINCGEDQNTYRDYSFSWSTGDTLKSFYLKADDLGAGSHKVWVHITNKTNGCETRDTITVNVGSTGMHDNSTETILIYPNPASQLVTIEGDQIEEIHIYNPKGQLVYSTGTRRNVYEVDLGDHSRGLYIAKIISRDKVFVRGIILK